MSEDTVKHRIHKYRVGDKFYFDGIVEILNLVKPSDAPSDQPLYVVKMPNNQRRKVLEGWIDAGIDRYSEENTQYGVSYIASAPEDFKVGDRVEVVKATDEFENRFFCRQGRVSNPTTPDGVNPYPDKVWVDFNGESIFYFYPSQLRKLPDAIHFDEQKGYRPIPLIDATSELVNRFKKITDEMVETYKAKNATYGNAYADGFSRFGAVQLVSRIYEKYCRIENLLVRKADNKVSDESVRDTLTDIANQCIILRMLLESQDVEFEDVK